MKRPEAHYMRLHFFYYLLKFIGMRDRLRCPSCGSVGTWKPHGGPLEPHVEGDTFRVQRWLCKWCGFYLRDGYDRVAYCGEHEWKPGPGPTPEEAVRSWFGRRIWPWFG